MLQSKGIESSEVRFPLLKFVNEDDIGMIEVLDNNKTTANKVPPIYIFPVCGKNTSNRLVIQNRFHSVTCRRIQLQIQPINLLMTPLNIPMVSFLVSTRL